MTRESDECRRVHRRTAAKDHCQQPRLAAPQLPAGFIMISPWGSSKEDGSKADAQAVAAELWAMCDEFWPARTMSTALWSVTDIAENILTNPIWSLWLD